ncbi:hypothetical protein [Nocardioides ochotonae]|uniref:hypothetical protein n=1 Tax=Nocardioides ochotonae TaxID=2685869 RepID=UPI0014086266|nr:hypothetical protein [Nocardioides ochotonae]
MSEAITTVLATACAGAFAGLIGYFTARASARGAVKTAQVTSLADIERGAAERAAKVYEGAIAQLEREQAEDRTEMAAMRERLAAYENDLAACKRLCRRLHRELRPDDSVPDL